MNSIIFLVLIVFEDVDSRDDTKDEEFVKRSNDCDFESFFLFFEFSRFDDELLDEAMKTKELKEIFETEFFEFETIIVDDDLKIDLTTNDVEKEKRLIESCFLIFFSVVSIAIVAFLVILSCFFNTHNFFLIEDDFESSIEISVLILTRTSCVEVTFFVKIST